MKKENKKGVCQNSGRSFHPPFQQTPFVDNYFLNETLVWEWMLSEQRVYYARRLYRFDRLK